MTEVRKLKSIANLLTKLGIPWHYKEDPIRTHIYFLGPDGEECEVSSGDYGNSWKGFSCSDRTAKGIEKAIIEMYRGIEI